MIFSLINKGRILLTANTGWYLFNFRWRLAQRLIEAGYEVAVAAAEDEYLWRFRDLGCQVYVIRMEAGSVNPVKELLAIYDIFVLSKKFKPGYICNFTPKNNIYVALVGQLFRVRIISNISGLGVSFVRGGILASITKCLYQISQRRVHRVLFQNERDMSLFISQGIVHSSKCERIPGSGVDLVRFVYAEQKVSGVTIFLMASRLIREKGVFDFVEAARLIKKEFGGAVHFLLAGKVDENLTNSISKEDIIRWEDEGVIEYCGFFDRMEDVYPMCDCFVLPSYYAEGVPRALLEAAACGRILVTTNNAGCADAVENSVNGFVVDAQNPNDLAESMRRVIWLRYDERKKMGRAGRVRMEAIFDEEIVLNRYLEIISVGF